MLFEINTFLSHFLLCKYLVSAWAVECCSKAFSECLVYSLTDHWNSSYRWKRTARPGKPQSQPTTAHRERERMILVLNYWCFLYFLDVVIDVTITLYPGLEDLFDGALECIKSDRKMLNVMVWIIWTLESLLLAALVRWLLESENLIS